MKQTLFTFVLLFCCLFTFAQSFEGEIVYQNTYKSKLPNVTDQQFLSMMGGVQNYYMKGGDYKSETNGTFVLWQLFINAGNKLYSKLANSEAVLWNDVTVNPDSVISSELHPGAAVVLGYTCDELVLNCKSGVQKYYFSSKLPVDSKLYANHLYGNWYIFLTKANAMPLKMIIDNAQLTLESIATEVKPMKLDPSLFLLPAGVQTAKSPY
ncbi:MAG: hypothetical protein ACHQIM_01640 [Sphingobacteriales bacterium]